MNQDAKPVVPGWYWVIAIVALLWNLMGCAAFGMELFAQEKMLETMTPDQPGGCDRADVLHDDRCRGIGSDGAIGRHHASRGHRPRGSPCLVFTLGQRQELARRLIDSSHSKPLQVTSHGESFPEAHPGGFEPPTCGLEVRECSPQPLATTHKYFVRVLCALCTF
ncbi:MAG: hypothetical protein VB862_02530 [Pirellulaceae bacterium]